MADSSLTRTGEQPIDVAGGDTRTLGPSDSSDSGSDVAGTGSAEWLDNDSDAAGTGERPSVNRRDSAEAPDLAPDSVEDDSEALAPDSVSIERIPADDDIDETLDRRDAEDADDDEAGS